MAFVALNHCVTVYIYTHTKITNILKFQPPKKKKIGLNHCITAVKINLSKDDAYQFAQAPPVVILMRLL